QRVACRLDVEQAERLAQAQRQIAERVGRQDLVRAGDLERDEPYREPFVDVEDDDGASALEDGVRVHDRLAVAALPVEQAEADRALAEHRIVDVAAVAGEAQPAGGEQHGAAAPRCAGLDGRAQQRVRKRVRADEPDLLDLEAVGPGRLRAGRRGDEPAGAGEREGDQCAAEGGHRHSPSAASPGAGAAKYLRPFRGKMWRLTGAKPPTSSKYM